MKPNPKKDPPSPEKKNLLGNERILKIPVIYEILVFFCFNKIMWVVPSQCYTLRIIKSISRYRKPEILSRFLMLQKFSLGVEI